MGFCSVTPIKEIVSKFRQWNNNPIFSSITSTKYDKDSMCRVFISGKCDNARKDTLVRVLAFTKLVLPTRN